MANIIEMLEKEEIARLGKNIPNFAPGDTVVVGVNVVEGTRKRVQAYEGVVVAIRNRGLNSSFIVRKISSGEGVERTFQTYSPLIASKEFEGDSGNRFALTLREVFRLDIPITLVILPEDSLTIDSFNQVKYAILGFAF